MGDKSLDVVFRILLLQVCVGVWEFLERGFQRVVECHERLDFGACYYIHLTPALVQQ